MIFFTVLLDKKLKPNNFSSYHVQFFLLHYTISMLSIKNTPDLNGYIQKPFQEFKVYITAGF